MPEGWLLDKRPELLRKEDSINNIEVLECAGTLTDHYDPTKKQVNLSTDRGDASN